MTLPPSLQTQIEKRLLPDRKQPLRFSTVGGGSINDTYCVQSETDRWFIKINSATKFPQLFLRESEGLAALARTNTFRIPEVVDLFESGQWQVLVLEWIPSRPPDPPFWLRLGEALAALHSYSAPQFGWSSSNYMGAAPQPNDWREDWKTFFLEQRIHPLISLCEGRQIINKREKDWLIETAGRMADLFDDEPPSLVHGDLWSGNIMCSAYGEPVLIDPAIHYGHSAADLSLTTLFGGFDPSFHEAYRYHRTLSPNWAEQWKAAGLYPLLVHLYLFGRSYWPRIKLLGKELA